MGLPISDQMMKFNMTVPRLRMSVFDANVQIIELLSNLGGDGVTSWRGI